MIKQAAVILSILITACSFKQTQWSDTHRLGIQLNQRAEKAYRAGEYEEALRLYHQALVKEQSIENIKGVAMNLMNIATVHRQLEQTEQAHQALDKLLDSSVIRHSPAHLSEGAFIKGLLYLDTAAYDQAEEWAERGLAYCREESCRAEGRLYNLLGRIALLRRNAEAAINWADQGLRANRSLKNLQETANSLRLKADVNSLKNQYVDAEKHYGQALVLDKKLGLSHKIAMDLMGIGDALSKQGKSQEALGYYRRALSVSESAGDKEGVVKAAERIKGERAAGGAF